MVNVCSFTGFEPAKLYFFLFFASISRRIYLCTRVEPNLGILFITLTIQIKNVLIYECVACNMCSF